MERRQYYRINYPVGDRPVLVIDDKKYSIANLSEGGALVAMVDEDMAIGTTIKGRIEFVNNRHCEIEGKVIRKDGEERIVFQLTEKVPLPLIMDEQRRLIKLYNRLQGKDKDDDDA